MSWGVNGVQGVVGQPDYREGGSGSVRGRGWFSKSTRGGTRVGDGRGIRKLT